MLFPLRSDAKTIILHRADVFQTLRNAGKHVAHLHLADNTRSEPGTGDIDFVATFRALNDIGFHGFMAYECGVSGDNDAEKANNLARSLDFVRECVAKSKA